jgi:hypothetical protein
VNESVLPPTVMVCLVVESSGSRRVSPGEVALPREEDDGAPF